MQESVAPTSVDSDNIASVTLVVPTFNRLDRLQRVLQALATQVVEVRLDVVVVSDGSSDGTNDYLASGDVPLPITPCVQANSGPAAARNRGIEMATGDLVLFIDDDVVPAPGLVQAHLDAHARLGADVVVIGPMLDPDDHTMSPWVQWEQDMLAKQYRAMDAGEYDATARQFYTGNASVRRTHLIAAGGFDPSFRRAEDVELAYRLEANGLRFAYESGAVGLHYAERSYTAWRENAYTYGRNDVIFARDLGYTWLWEFIAKKYRSHHSFVRAITALTLPRRHLTRVINTTMKLLADVGARLRLNLVMRGALSSIYSIQYHRGVADELGGPESFHRLVSSRPAAAAP